MIRLALLLTLIFASQAFAGAPPIPCEQDGHTAIVSRAPTNDEVAAEPATMPATKLAMMREHYTCTAGSWVYDTTVHESRKLVNGH